MQLYSNQKLHLASTLKKSREHGGEFLAVAVVLSSFSWLLHHGPNTIHLHQHLGFHGMLRFMKRLALSNCVVSQLEKTPFCFPFFSNLLTTKHQTSAMLGKRFHLFLNQNILQYTFEIVWPSVLQSFVKLKLYDSKQTCPICIHIHNSNAILNQPSHEAIWDSYLICVIFWSEVTFPTMKPRTFEASFPENLRKIASPPGCLPGGRKNGTPDSGVMICRSFSIHVQVKPSLTPQAPGLRTLWDCKQCYQSAGACWVTNQQRGETGKDRKDRKVSRAPRAKVHPPLLAPSQVRLPEKEAAKLLAILYVSVSFTHIEDAMTSWRSMAEGQLQRNLWKPFDPNGPTPLPCWQRVQERPGRRSKSSDEMPIERRLIKKFTKTTMSFGWSTHNDADPLET